MYMPPFLFWSLSVSFLSFLLVLSTSPMIMNMDTYMFEWPLLQLNSTQIPLTFIMDPHNSLFMLVVLIISINVLLFSGVYMSGPNQPRFYLTLMAFIGSMLLLVSMPNLMSLMLGWDGLGITSFLLITHYQTPEAAGSAMVTLLSNRMGDSFLLLSLAMLLSSGQWTLTSLWSSPYSTSILLLIVLASMTKSAQTPFHLWLPEAMAAPTPVSALVHSSTLVTAGLFLLMRVFYTICDIPYLLNLMKIVGTSTMMVAALDGCVMKDTKKVIAYSTMSQLGLMMISLGWGAPTLAFYHMVTHAMFKALMFISMGVMIMLKKHKQGTASIKAKKYQKLLGMTLKISIFALNAMPFTAGFYSKDPIFEMLIAAPETWIIWPLYVIPTAFTMTYSIRLIRASVTATNRQARAAQITHQLNVYSILPTSIMTVMAMVMGATAPYMFMTTHTPTFLSLKYNIIILTLPLFGMAFATTTCIKIVKKKTSWMMACNANKEHNTCLKHHQVSLMNWALMTPQCMIDSRAETYLGDSGWPIMHAAVKHFNSLSLMYIKYMEKTTFYFPSLILPKTIQKITSHHSLQLMTRWPNLMASLLASIPLIIMMLI